MAVHAAGAGTRRHVASTASRPAHAGPLTGAVLGAGIGVGIAAVGFCVARGFGAGAAAAAFAVLVVLGEVLRLELGDDRDTAPIALAGGIAYAAVPLVAGGAEHHNAAQSLGLVALGLLAGGLVHVVGGRSLRPAALSRRLLAVAAAAAVTQLAAANGPVTGLGAREVLLALAALLAAVIDLALGSLLRTSQLRGRVLTTLRADAAATSWLSASVLATAVLLALTAPMVDTWALPVFALPLLVTQVAFRKRAQVRTLSRQTFRSLARVTEVGGYVHDGHAGRVSELAVAVGRAGGLGDAALSELEIAALMHDIGQLSLSAPIPGGSPLTVSAAEQRRIAELGADVVRAAGRLDHVAAILEKQAEPYRGVGQASDPAVPYASRVIKAVSAYDDLTAGALGEALTPAEAIDALRQSMAYDYDPAVVETLARVVARA